MNELEDISKELSHQGFRVIFLGPPELLPMKEWKEFREIPLTDSEIHDYFLNVKIKPIGLALALRGKGIRCLSIDIDGKDAEQVFFDEFMPLLPNDIQNDIKKSPRTVTKSNGLHILLRIDEKEGFTDIIRQQGKWSGITIEKAEGSTKHSQINILGTEHMTREFGPGYKSIIGIDSQVRFKMSAINEILHRQTGFKHATQMIRIAGNVLKSLWKSPDRNKILFHCSGFLGKNGVPEALTIRFFNHIVRVTALSDENKAHTLSVIHDTYEKISRGEVVSGYEGFKEAVGNSQSIIDEIQSCFKQLGYFQDYQNGNNNDSQQKEGFSEQVWIPNEVKQELKKHKWALISHNPQKFMIAHSQFNQTLETRLQSRETKEATGAELKMYFLKFGKIFINAIPIEVTTYEDRISMTLDRRYKIKFRTSTGRIFTSRSHSTLDVIVTELVDKALAYSAQEGKEALSRIINAFENEGDMIVSREIETPGFYQVDGRIKAFQIDIKTPTREELAEAALFMNELVEKHNRKEIPATTIKWSTIAPFDYVLKQYTDDLCWLPWLGLAGWPRSGKGTQGRIACGMWEDFYHHSIKNYLPFTAINTEARLGHKLSQCTFPLTFNECDALNDDKNKNILEMMKNCMETRISRGKYQTRTIYIDEPALSPCILTSNPAFPSELGFRSRIIYIVYTKEDKYWDSLAAKEFTAFISKGRRHLRTYGHFAARYSLDNPQVLLKENVEDCDWKETSERVLQEFYKAASLPIPEWVSLFVNETDVTEAAIQEANETALFELRGFFIQTVNNAYRIDPVLDAREEGREVSFEEKLDRCLNRQLISYLHKHQSRTGIAEVVISHDILRELKRNKVSNISTLPALAREIPEFIHGEVKVNGHNTKVVHGLHENFVKFLNCRFEEDSSSQC